MFQSLKRRKTAIITILAVLFLSVFLGMKYGPSFLLRYYRPDNLVAQRTLEGPFEITLDMTDLEGNRGKVLYQDDGCTITVTQVREDISKGRHYYSVYFSCSPEVSLDGVRQVTGWNDNWISGSPDIINGDAVYMAPSSGGNNDVFGYHLPLHDPALNTPENQYSFQDVLPDTLTLSFPFLLEKTWA